VQATLLDRGDGSQTRDFRGRRQFFQERYRGTRVLAPYCQSRTPHRQYRRSFDQTFGVTDSTAAHEPIDGSIQSAGITVSLHPHVHQRRYGSHIAERQLGFDSQCLEIAAVASGFP
jgi:hypothetical protein